MNVLIVLLCRSCPSHYTAYQRIWLSASPSVLKSHACKLETLKSASAFRTFWRAQRSRSSSIWKGVPCGKDSSSSIVELVACVLGEWLVVYEEAILPFVLSFATGEQIPAFKTIPFHAVLYRQEEINVDIV